MAALVVDTHAVIWYLLDDPRLSVRAGAALDQACDSGDSIHVPLICLVEATYLTEKGRIAPLAMQKLSLVLREPDGNFRLAPLEFRVATAVADIPRDQVPDLPDRVIAATALALDLPLVTRDAKIQAADIQTIW